MPRVLVVDDTEIQRALVRRILEREERYEVEEVADGLEALEWLSRKLPDLILADLVMPRMGGLELTAEVRRRHPGVPVVIMTARGNEQVAVQALVAGAASYVPKAAIEAELRQTLSDVLEAARIQQSESRVMSAIRRCETTFALPPDENLISPLVKHLQVCASVAGLSDEAEWTQVGIALHEALSNALHHGNLEVSSELREQDFTAYLDLIEKRGRESPYCDRMIHVTSRFSPEEATFVIRDEGRGFDPATLPDPRDPENLERVCGRGVVLMRSFMDEVAFNETGNQVTLVKRRDAKQADRAPPTPPS